MDAATIMDFVVAYKWWLAAAAPIILAIVVVKILQ
jgi:hypothetical protein